jgi:hypothetical protein
MGRKLLRFIAATLFLIIAALILLQSYLKSNPKLQEKIVGCKSYGSIDQSFYLNEYKVKDGDTLLSIAQNETGKSSRVDELIQLNKNKFPNLSLENPTIETGWVFYVLPSFFPRSSGYIRGLSGKISKIDEKSITISLKRNKLVEEISYKMPSTIYLGKNLYVPGDCIYIIKDNSNRVGTGILAVSSQDKNYFKNPSDISIIQEKPAGKCEFYGYLDEDFYLSTYVTKKGDSLATIAGNQLGDVKRVSELINLNRSSYPHLSEKESFLEIGWPIKLPTASIPGSQGFLRTVGGEIQEISNGNIFVDIGYRKQGFDTGPAFKIQPWTRYFGTNSVRVGECIYLIEGTNNNQDGILAISPQGKNYFK